LYLGFRHLGEDLIGGLQRCGSARSDALGDRDAPVAVCEVLHGVGVLRVRAQATLVPPDGLLPTPSGFLHDHALGLAAGREKRSGGAAFDLTRETYTGAVAAQRH
jgi:hypothetical protein